MSTKNMFPDSYDLLQMPEIWIGDTTATTDMTPHQTGMTEVASPQEDIHVVVGKNKWKGRQQLDAFQALCVTIKAIKNSM